MSGVIIEKLDSFTSEGGGNVVPGNPARWDKVRIRRGNKVTETFYCPPQPVAPSQTRLVLSATDFIDHAVLQLGGDMNASARFQEIIEAARSFPGGTTLAKNVRFAMGRYDKTTTFRKPVVDQLLTLFVTAGIATTNEKDAIVNNWPTG